MKVFGHSFPSCYLLYIYTKAFFTFVGLIDNNYYFCDCKMLWYHSTFWFIPLDLADFFSQVSGFCFAGAKRKGEEQRHRLNSYYSIPESSRSCLERLYGRWPVFILCTALVKPFITNGKSLFLLMCFITHAIAFPTYFDSHNTVSGSHTKCVKCVSCLQLLERNNRTEAEQKRETNFQSARWWCSVASKWMTA